MSWVLVIGGGWLVLAALTALLVARAIHLADLEAEKAAQHSLREPNFVVDDRPVAPDAGAARQDAGAAGRTPAGPVADPPGSQAPTIPGLPAARPRLVPPPVPDANSATRRSSRG